MRLVRTLVLGALSAAALAASALSASAAVACTGNVCWHVHDRYHFPRESGVVIHRDYWRPGPGITFREHEGRGYWRGDDWVAW